MRRLGSLLMSSVLVTACTSVATNNESLRVILERSGQSYPRLSAYEQGKRQLQFRNPGLAVQSFQQALQENPGSVDALNGLAIAYERLARPDVAQTYLDQALKLDPESAITLNNLAYLNLVQGNTAVALAYAERAKMAVDHPMEMMLPDTIARAVDRTAEIASQVAVSERQVRAVAQAKAAPRESNIRRVGVNEWELRIQPPNSADSVRINLPARDAIPRVIEPMARLAPPPVVTEPLAEIAMDHIPDSVMADLMLPPSVTTESAAVPLPGPANPEPELPEPSLASLLAPDARVRVLALPGGDALTAARVPAQPVPDPAQMDSVIALLPLPEPRMQALPIAPRALPSTPAQPLPEPVQMDSLIASLPLPEPRMKALPIAPHALPSTPAQPLPEPVQMHSVIASLPLPEPRRQALPLATRAVTAPAQPLPEPIQMESVIASLPVPEPRMQTLPLAPSAPSAAPAQPLPEPVQMESVIASLPIAEPRMRTLPLPPSGLSLGTQLLPEAARVEPEVIASVLAPQRSLSSSLPIAPAVQSRAPDIAPAAQTVQPLLASLPPVAAASRAAAPATSYVSHSWKAYVPSGTRLRVSNGTGRGQMASRFARYFGEHGLSVRKVANANSFDYRRTTIFYNPDQRDYAHKLADQLPFSVRLIEAKQGRGEVEVILGFDLVGVDDTLRSA